ncbi:hypothetical protein C3489_07545 [Streptomyces sp. Ru71]|nr:hypothetical protein C3489_07545 [Streptomyces sp. Ru71]
MTPSSATIGRQHDRFVPPPPAESLPLPPPQQPDPPIYRAVLRVWAEGGRTLPGRHDPEWVRLAAPLVRPGQFGGLRGPGEQGPSGSRGPGETGGSWGPGESGLSGSRGPRDDGR